MEAMPHESEPVYDDEFVERAVLDTGFAESDLIREHLSLPPIERLRRLEELSATLIILRNARERTPA
jgi:hypothetical protein